MKTIITFTTLLIFLHTATNHLISTEAKDGLPDPVLDEDGYPLLSEFIYYVRPIMIGPGGLILRQVGNKNCTFRVSQELIGDGLPVGFNQPPSIQGGVIRESLDTNIMFPAAPIGCKSSSGVWKVDEYDASTGQYFIVTDGVVGNPGVNNWFRIEKIQGCNHHYKFVYIDTCPKCIPMHSGIDFFKDGTGMGLLALAKTSYAFKFRRFEYQAERH